MKKYCFLLFVTISIYTYGQHIDSPKILPPSPNAASLGQYGQVPVGLFTGTPQISVPIYQASDGKLTLPISLSYSSNGIRLDEMASNVGLGWSLNAGGVITRSINDGPDEEQFLLKPYGFPTNNNSQTILDYLNSFIDPDDSYDTQSDTYSFNFSGYTGTFYLDQNRKPILNNASPLKVVKNPPAPHSDYEFIIIDPFGTIYSFGNSNSTEETRYRQLWTGDHPVPGPFMPTSWYLSKIQNVFGDEISLSYVTKEITYHAALSQSVIAKADQNAPSTPGEFLGMTQATLKYIKLDNISTRTEKIDLSYSTSIQAISSSFDKLSEIQIKQKGGALLKKFVLGYDIVTSNLQNLKNPHFDYRDFYGKRLFLKSVTEYGDGPDFKNPFEFSYYNPEMIPPRFSYAQDYWGYYNGITNNQYLVSNGDYFFAHDSNAALLEGIFHNVGGNKKPNGIFGKNGLLKKVTYPTGGFNELLYEPHNYYGTVLIPPNVTPASLHPNSMIADCSDAPDPYEMDKYMTIGPIPFTHSNLLYPTLFDEAKVPINLSAEVYPCWEDCFYGWPSHFNVGHLSIKDHDDPSREIIIYQRTSSGGWVPQQNPFTVSPVNGNHKIYIDLEEGKTYDFHYYFTSQSRCTRADMGFSYYKRSFTTEETNIEVGGSRIKKITSDDGDGNPEIKNYYYGDKYNLGHSSGIAQKPTPSITYTRFYNFTPYSLQCGGCGTYHEIDQLTLNSGNLYNLYGKSGHQIGYTSVIEEYGNDFKGGGIMHKFQVTADTGPYKENESWPIPGTPFDKNFGTGNELETEIFTKSNNAFKTLRKTINHYKKHTVLSRETTNYSVRLRNVIGFGLASTIGQKINSFDIFSYFQRSAFLYMDSSTTTEYDDNENPTAVTTTTYKYNNIVSLQPSKVSTSRAGDDKILITKTDYPDDLLEAPYMYNLSVNGEHRIAEPIRVRTYQNKGNGEELLSTQKTVYDDFGGLILPKSVQTAKGAKPLENRLEYHSYDHYGNLREVSRPDGSRTVYVMGYDFTLPVAKLENVTIGDIPQGMLNEIYTASTSGNEATLLQKLDALRDHITTIGKAALVTTLTYKPLIGVHTVTDPKGYKMTYEYDDFGRLKYVKDMDENILSENEYHYIND